MALSATVFKVELGVSDVDVRFAYSIMIGAAIVLYVACVWLLQKGVGTRE